MTTKVDLKIDEQQQASVLFSHGKRSQATAYRGSTLPLPYAVTRWVEEIPTSAQLKHTHVLGSQWVNQASFGFSRLAVPIENATIDGQYPIKAGLRGLPPGEADSSFPEVAFAGPNAPAGWRGTDARAFTEYLNNFTLQNNLSWTHGRHTTTFGFQAQRMDADERERTYGSLATFGFSNLQTAGFGPTGTLDAASGNAYASYLLGELNATTVIEDSEVATSGRFYTYAFWAQDDFKLRPRPVAQSRSPLRHHEAVHGALRSVVVHGCDDAESRRRRLSRRGGVRRRRTEQLQLPYARSRRTTAPSGRASVSHTR